MTIVSSALLLPSALRVLERTLGNLVLGVFLSCAGEEVIPQLRGQGAWARSGARCVAMAAWWHGA